jgi:hypothetical protein
LDGRSRVVLVLLVCAALVVTGCQPSTVISTLEAVVASAEVALPVIAAATGLSHQVAAQIVAYLQMVDTTIMQASVILAGPGTGPDKAARIVEAFAGIAAGCNCVPPGTPQTVIAVVDAVAKAVARFLSNFAATQPVAKAVPAIKISRSDRAALTDIRQRAEQQLTKLKGVKP